MEDLMQKVREGRGTDAACMLDYCTQIEEYAERAGDDCVRAIAALIRQMESDQIFCARYGGDEFVIIYSGMSAEEVCERAEKLRQDVMALQI